MINIWGESYILAARMEKRVNKFPASKEEKSSQISPVKKWNFSSLFDFKIKFLSGATCS